MPLSIVYEDSNLLVINKPAGIAVHKAGPTDDQLTIVDEVLVEYPEIAQVGEDPIRPGIVHRLDKETSGLMIVAKTNPAFFYLKGLFQNRKISKHYQALVHGVVKNKTGTIDVPLGKLGTKQTTQLHGKKELVVRDAVTDYEVLKTYAGFTLLDVAPLTGRTHQIRVHLKSIGHPIVGDTLYAPKGLPTPPESTRLFLHAYRLSFITPDGKSLTLETDLPIELQNILKDLPA